MRATRKAVRLPNEMTPTFIWGSSLVLEAHKLLREYSKVPLMSECTTVSKRVTGPRCGSRRKQVKATTLASASARFANGDSATISGKRGADDAAI
jgi:hypothetical protein